MLLAQHDTNTVAQIHTYIHSSNTHIYTHTNIAPEYVIGISMLLAQHDTNTVAQTHKCTHTISALEYVIGISMLLAQHDTNTVAQNTHVCTHTIYAPGQTACATLRACAVLVIHVKAIKHTDMCYLSSRNIQTDWPRYVPVPIDSREGHQAHEPVLPFL
jgi:hypothetical protein